MFVYRMAMIAGGEGKPEKEKGEKNIDIDISTLCATGLNIE